MTEEEFRESFLDAASRCTGTDADRFFNPFLVPYLGDPLATIRTGMALLNKCHSLDETKYKNIPKGTPFYWLGAAAYQLHDYESALFFLDAAVAEDLELKFEDGPAMQFFLLNGEPRNQAARNLVQDAQNIIVRSIDYYNGLSGATPFTIVQLREQFLRKALLQGNEHLRSLATPLITFGLEWDGRNQLIDIRPRPGTTEPFFLHLFKGCVLFESILRQNPECPDAKKKQDLKQLLDLLAPKLGFMCGKINSKLPTILTDLDRINPRDETVKIAIEFTGKLRNTVGHDLGWKVHLGKIQYQRLFQMVMASCFHAIACLY